MSGRTEFNRVFQRHLVEHTVDRQSSILIIGGSDDDVASLREIGFADITISNIEGGVQESFDSLGVKVVTADAEDLALPDGSYDVVFVHAVLHHCRSPHLALCEILRVARHHVVFLEPHDSASTRLLTRIGLSFPYEIAAVIDNNYVLGGVRNTNIPNFIYRWDEKEVIKTASAFLAEYEVSVTAEPFWNFEVDERGLALRFQTRIPRLSRMIGPRRMVRLLGRVQSLMNRRPFRGQGNNLFCWIAKTPKLKPWLVRSESGDVEFNRQYGS